MYARSVVLVFTIIFSTGFESCVCTFKDEQHLVQKGAPSTRETTKNDEKSNSNIHGSTKYRNAQIWNHRVSVNDDPGTLRLLNKEEPAKRNLRFDLQHHRHGYHHYHHRKFKDEVGQEQKIDLLNPGHTRIQGEVLKFIDPKQYSKKDLVKPFSRKQHGKKLTRISEKEGRKDEIKKNHEKHGKGIQKILPPNKTNKRFMVIRGPGKNAPAKRKRFHFSHALVNALKLVLDKRNSFKKDANILDLATALQSRDNNEKYLYGNNSITTGVSRGLTQNGQRVRLVRVKDPGYVENPIHKNGFGSKNPVYRSKITQDAKHSHSTLVNPTELGVSILKLLFGKKARIVTKPKYRHLVGAKRPNMKYLEGYGSKKQRAELEREIEKENQMILLNGVKKHRLEETLAKSISNLIHAMNRDKVGTQEKGNKEKSQTNEHDSEVNKTNGENAGRKVSSVEDHIGTRKSWVLLKMPKKNEEVLQEKVSPYHGTEKQDDNPSKISIHQVSTLGKKNNELSDIKVMHQHKPRIESSYDDVASDDENHAGRLKNPSVLTKYTHTDTESRTVPQISYNLNSIKSKSNDQKLSGVDPNGLALTLGKILKGIQESVKELRHKSKPKEEANPVSSDAARITSPATTSLDTSSLANSNAMAKIPDLLAAVNKLLGSTSSQLPIHSEMSGIPSDQTSVQNVPTMDNTDAAGTRRYVDGIRASTDPLQLRPSIGYFDEPITVSSKTGVGDEKSLDNVLFESDELATQRDRQATVDAIKLKEDLEAFAERGLNTHNKYRSLHHAQNLKWSDELATQAEKMAYDMAMKGTIEKSAVASALGYGENVAKITGTTFNKAGEEAANLWYAEVANYSFSDPRLSPQTDSFTQVVWKGTITLGMGCARDLQTNDLYVVALYDPKGNDPVGLRSNVLNKGGVTEDVYASIFKRERLQRKMTSRNKIGKS